MANTTKDPNVEAAKTIGRNGILAAVSSLITALVNWIMAALFTVHLPSEVLVSLGALLYAGALYLDNWIHNNKNIDKNGLVSF